MDITSKVTEAVRAYRQWSPAEERHMDAIIEEILIYVRTGKGNVFIRQWCERNMKHLF